ncbi:hypothetical protein DFH06DRAFT_1137874 [Mycena polygramma]|nr:hypothetical protein DFH06DRAFT_1137874 [Mycena polygramma]
MSPVPGPPMSGGARSLPKTMADDFRSTAASRRALPELFGAWIRTPMFGFVLGSFDCSAVIRSGVPRLNFPSESKTVVLHSFLPRLGDRWIRAEEGKGVLKLSSSVSRKHAVQMLLYICFYGEGLARGSKSPWPDLKLKKSNFTLPFGLQTPEPQHILGTAETVMSEVMKVGLWTKISMI